MVNTNTMAIAALTVVLIFIFVLPNPKFKEFSQKLLGDITGGAT